MGRRENVRMPSTAASSSSMSLKVSMRNKSTPRSSSAPACSLKMATMSWCGFSRLAGNFHGAMIQLGHAIGHAELPELVAIGAESIGLDDLRAGFDIGLMDVKDSFAVRDVELVDAALWADGFIEQRAHGAVADEDSPGQSFIEIFDAHGSWFLPVT